MLRRVVATMGLLVLTGAAFVSAASPANAASSGSINWSARTFVAGAPATATLKGPKGFRVSIDWDDGKVTAYSCAKAACTRSASHVYAAAGKYLVSAFSRGQVIASVSLTITAGAPNAFDSPAWASDMLNQVNAVRTKAGAKPLALCAPLTTASGKYAKLMADSNYFDHVGPDGRQPWDRGTAEGYRYTEYGENIAAGQKSVDAVMTGWINSPGHYANLVSTRFTHLGVGRASSTTADYSDYWVQNFGAGGNC